MKQSNTTKKKISVVQIVRIIIQLLCFVLIPSLYINALNGLRELWLAVLHQSFTAALWPDLVEVLAIVPVTLLLGRFFCGWMCAFGAYTDFLYGIVHRCSTKKRRMPEKTDLLLKKAKYVVLVLLILVVWTLGVSAFQSGSPWNVFGMLTTVGKVPSLPIALLPGLLLLLVISVLSAVYERFFCRYLCPLGAAFTIVSRPRIAKITKPSSQCGDCRACTNTCAMGIPLYRMDKVSSGECINCMKCTAVCPRGNARLTIAQSDVRPLVAGAAATAMMAGIYYSGTLMPLSSTAVQSNSSVVSSTAETASSSVADAAASTVSTASSQASSVSSSTGKYKDGTYQGTGSGFRGDTQVTVTISGGKISNIHVDSYQDDQRFFERAYEQISQEIISSQSNNVDAVSGATFSSKGIMEAVANALTSAKS